MLVMDTELSAPKAPRAALVFLLLAVLVTGVLDGVAQPAVFVDAAQAGPVYTHVSSHYR